ncbi:MAG: SIR2 family protein [Candidatus Hermodarchaeota archaeon]
MGIYTDNEPLERLKIAYQTKRLFLALGSGVSKQSTLPNWEELIRRLMLKAYKEKSTMILDNLKTEGYSLPAIASVVENKLGSENFSEHIREAIYQHFHFFKKELDPDALIKFIQDRNLTMRSVASLCVIKEDGYFMANPHIRAIANFNMDSVLRAYIRFRYRNPGITKPNDPRFNPVRTIERPSNLPITDRLSMYQMHGYLRFEKDAIRKLAKESPDLRVFTEQEYFNFFSQPNNIFTYTFLHLLREHSCLFIGVSMNDDNIRRLLHYSKTETVESFEKEGIENPLESRKKAIFRHFTIQKEIDPEIKEVIEKSLWRLGVYAIWVKKFEDIDKLLKELYESTGEYNWEDVF